MPRHTTIAGEYQGYGNPLLFHPERAHAITSICPPPGRMGMPRWHQIGVFSPDQMLGGLCHVTPQLTRKPDPKIRLKGVRGCHVPRPEFAQHAATTPVSGPPGTPAHVSRTGDVGDCRVCQPT